MKKTIPFVFLFLSVFAYPQEFYLQWQNAFGTINNDDVDNISKTHFGYIILSSIDCPDSCPIPGYQGGRDPWLIATDHMGNKLWERCYGGSKTDLFIKILETEDRHYYMYGYTKSTDGDAPDEPIHGAGNSWLMYADSNWNKVWSVAFGCDLITQGRDAILTSDGGIITVSRINAGGFTVQTHYGGNNIYVCKFSKTGVMEWQLTIGNTGLTNALRIRKAREEPVESYYIIGSSHYMEGMITCEKDNDPNAQDVHIWEVDAKGELIWQNCYGGSAGASGGDLGYDIVALKDGFTFVASTKSKDMDISNNPWNDAIWLVRCDSDGNILWDRCYGGPGQQYPRFLDRTADGNYVIMGESNSTGGDVMGNHKGSRDVWAFITDSLGNMLWSRCYGSNREDYASYHNFAKAQDYEYTIGVQARSRSGDIVWLPYSPYGESHDIWVFSLKACSPPQNTSPAGPATACSLGGGESIYTVMGTDNLSTEWRLEPEGAGELFPQGDTLHIAWANGYEGTVAIIARGVNHCGESVWSEPFYTQVETCLGVGTLSPGAISIYPNPAGDRFYVSIKETMGLPAVFTLYNPTGRRVLEASVESRQAIMDCSAWPAGIYFWTVKSKEGWANGKIVLLPQKDK